MYLDMTAGKFAYNEDGFEKDSKDIGLISSSTIKGRSSKCFVDSPFSVTRRWETTEFLKIAVWLEPYVQANRLAISYTVICLISQFLNFNPTREESAFARTCKETVLPSVT